MVVILFLPAAGWVEEGVYRHENDYGYYALRDTSGDDSAWLYSFRPHKFYKVAWPRERHATVRLATVVSGLAGVIASKIECVFCTCKIISYICD